MLDDAARRGDAVAFRRQLERGARPSVRTISDVVSGRSLECLRLACDALVDNDVDFTIRAGSYHAASYGTADAFEFLLTRAELGRPRWSHFAFAVARGNIETMRWIVWHSSQHPAGFGSMNEFDVSESPWSIVQYFGEAWRLPGGGERERRSGVDACMRLALLTFGEPFRREVEREDRILGVSSYNVARALRAFRRINSRMRAATEALREGRARLLRRRLADALARTPALASRDDDRYRLWNILISYAFSSPATSRTPSALPL